VLFLSLLHLHAEVSRPSVVRIPVDNVSALLIPNNSLPQFIDVDLGVFAKVKVGRPIYAVDIVKKSLQCANELLVWRTRDELEWLDDVWPYGSGGVRDDVRDEIASR
jgi:hypothetical protein